MCYNLDGVKLFSKDQKDRGETYSMIDELMIGFLVKTVPEEIETPT